MIRIKSIGKRIAVIGSPGSGKTFLSNKLSSLLNLSVYHLDDLFWHEDWIPTESEKWEEIVEQLVKQQGWIIDGNYIDTLDLRIESADTVVFLDTPLWKCLFRAVKRTLENYFNKGMNLPTRIREAHLHKSQKFSEGIFEFSLFIIRFHKYTKPLVIDKLNKQYNNRKIIVLRSNIDVERFLLKGGNK